MCPTRSCWSRAISHDPPKSESDADVAGLSRRETVGKSVGFRAWVRRVGRLSEGESIELVRGYTARSRNTVQGPNPRRLWEAPPNDSSVCVSFSTRNSVVSRSRLGLWEEFQRTRAVCGSPETLSIVQSPGPSQPTLKNTNGILNRGLSFDVDSSKAETEREDALRETRPLKVPLGFWKGRKRAPDDVSRSREARSASFQNTIHRPNRRLETFPAGPRQEPLPGTHRLAALRWSPLSLFFLLGFVFQKTPRQVRRTHFVRESKPYFRMFQPTVASTRQARRRVVRARRAQGLPAGASRQAAGNPHRRRRPSRLSHSRRPAGVSVLFFFYRVFPPSSRRLPRGGGDRGHQSRRQSCPSRERVHVARLFNLLRARRLRPDARTTRRFF